MAKIPFIEPESDAISEVVKSLKSMSESIERIESADPFKMTIKADTGDPSSTDEGIFCINTFDNNFKIYADGAWRTIISW